MKNENVGVGTLGDLQRKHNNKSVGVGVLDDPKKNHNGITLIALIITIILMLILVAITLTIVLTGGLFGQASKAAEDTKDAIEYESNELLEDVDDYINEYTGGTKKATIPEGFTKVEGDEGTGLVIKADVGEDVGESEFVWIPVPNPVLDVSTAANDTGINNAIKAKVDAGEYPMAIKLADGKYKGVLYDFTLDTAVTPNVVKVTARTYTTGETSFREPAYLTDITTGDASINNTVGITESLLQEEYDEMVKSVIKYGGFYCR